MPIQSSVGCPWEIIQIGLSMTNAYYIGADEWYHLVGGIKLFLGNEIDLCYSLQGYIWWETNEVW